MALFAKYCEICGKKIGKGNYTVRFGKYFDSEMHAGQYTREIEARRPSASEKSTHSNDCCCPLPPSCTWA